MEGTLPTPYRHHEGATASVNVDATRLFEYLDDSTHQYAGQKVPMPELPEWLIHDGETHEFVPYNADWHMPRCKVCKEFEDHPNHGGAEEAGQ